MVNWLNPLVHWDGLIGNVKSSGSFAFVMYGVYFSFSPASRQTDMHARKVWDVCSLPSGPPWCYWCYLELLLLGCSHTCWGWELMLDQFTGAATELIKSRLTTWVNLKKNNRFSYIFDLMVVEIFEKRTLYIVGFLLRNSEIHLKTKLLMLLW